MTALDRAAATETFLNEVIDWAPAGPVAAARPAPRLRRILLALDAVAAFAGWSTGLITTSAVDVPAGTPEVATTWLAAVLLTAVTILAITAQRLYLARMCTIRAVEIARLGRAVSAAAIAALVMPRVLTVELSIPGAVVGASLAFVGLNGCRGVYRHWLQVGRRNGRFLRSMVIIGANEETYDLVKLIDDHPELGYRVAGVVGDGHDVDALGLDVRWLGPVDDTLGAVRRSGANGAVMAASAVPTRQLNAIVRALLRNGIHVHLSSGVRGIDHRRLRAQPLAHEPLFYVEPMRLSPWQVVVKRMIDIAVTVAGSVVVLPVLAVAAIAIKLQDRGPVLYRQTRVGRHGRHFTVLKLRTMVPNAEALYDELARGGRSGRDGPLIKLADDPRRTRVGRFLERLSIDELPQLWNVLRGEMSLVGPRPAQPSEVARFDEELKTRHEVAPGITGLWQVEARDNPSFAAYRRFDLFYIENWSVNLDLAILVATVQRVVLRGVAFVLRREPEMGVIPPGGNLAPTPLD